MIGLNDEEFYYLRRKIPDVSEVTERMAENVDSSIGMYRAMAREQIKDELNNIDMLAKDSSTNIDIRKKILINL